MPKLYRFERVEKCLTCQARFEDPKFESIKGATARIYYDLKMKCINPSYAKTMTTLDNKVYDEKCPITFEKCMDCGFKARRGPKSDHFCVKVLKGGEELFIKRKEVEKRPEEPSWVDAIWVLIFIVFIFSSSEISRESEEE